MPVYEYICVDCLTKFDALRSISQADDAIACAHCNGVHTRRVLSVFAIKGGDGAMLSPSTGGGCACGGACSCGGHAH